MAYEVIALDLDGTLTNSQKVITEPTRRGLIELQKSGKTVVLASGRPINGVVYLAEELELQSWSFRATADTPSPLTARGSPAARTGRSSATRRCRRKSSARSGNM